MLRTLKVKSRTQAVLAVSDGYRTASVWRARSAVAALPEPSRRAASRSNPRETLETAMKNLADRRSPADPGRGCRTVIEGLRANVELVTAETAQQARNALAAGSASFDLVLLDLHLGDADGFELLTEMREAYPALSVVVVSASDRNADIMRAIGLGAMGFVPKRASNEQLLEALRAVSGGIYVPPVAMRSSAAAGRLEDEHTCPSLESFKLTPRQTEVLSLLLRGQWNKLIARELNLSVETIKDHVAAVLRALGVASRTQAVLAVSQMSNQGILLAAREPVRHLVVSADCALVPAQGVNRRQRPLTCVGPQAGLARSREIRDADKRLAQNRVVDRLGQAGVEMPLDLVVGFGGAHGDETRIAVRAVAAPGFGSEPLTALDRHVDVEQHRVVGAHGQEVGADGRRRCPVALVAEPVDQAGQRIEDVFAVVDDQDAARRLAGHRVFGVVVFGGGGSISSVNVVPLPGVLVHGGIVPPRWSTKAFEDDGQADSRPFAPTGDAGQHPVRCEQCRENV